MEAKVRIWDRRCVGGDAGAEGGVVARRGDSDLGSYSTSRRRAGVGKSQDGSPSSSSSPDKYEGSEQSDQDEAGESGDGDEECVELHPKSRSLSATAAGAIPDTASCGRRRHRTRH